MMRFASICLAIVLAPCFVLADSDLDDAKSIKKIELLGGKIKRDESSAGRPVIGIDLEGSQRLTDGHLHLLKAFAHLRSLNLRNTRVTDEGMEQIGGLTSLTNLDLANCDVSDAGLTPVRQLLRLQELNLSNTWIADQGLRELSNLKDLRTLIVVQTPISDAKVTELNKSLPNLQIIRRTVRFVSQNAQEPRLGRGAAILPGTNGFIIINEK